LQLVAELGDVAGRLRQVASLVADGLIDSEQGRAMIAQFDEAFQLDPQEPPSRYAHSGGCAPATGDDCNQVEFFIDRNAGRNLKWLEKWLRATTFKRFRTIKIDADDYGRRLQFSQVVNLEGDNQG
jgi:hypothetical protein